MKEATGELSMTVVTILAIVLIAGVIYFLVPLAKNYISKTWGDLTNEEIDKNGYVEVIQEGYNI